MEQTDELLDKIITLKASYSVDEKSKAEQIDQLAEEVYTKLKLFEESDSSKSATAKDKAKLLYVKAKLLDCKNSDDSKIEEIERLLTKSIKLDQSNIDAWNTLGNCLWKQGKLENAKDCFQGALAQDKNHTESVCNLSMILRQLGSTAEEKVKNTTDSLKYAKQAVGLDLTNSHSWYVLGNTYLALFFAMSHKHSDLDLALKAYKKSADLITEGSENPDLCYNRAQVLVYLEEYEEAIKDFKAALKLDAKLPATTRIEEIERRVKRINELVAKKGKLKSKKLASIMSSFTDDDQKSADDSRTMAVLTDLQPGENKGKSMSLRLLTPINNSNDAPLSFVMIDAASNVFVISVYHLASSVLDKSRTSSDKFLIHDPFLKQIECVTRDNTVCEYPLLQIKLPQNFLINNEILKANVVHAAMATTAFDQ